MNPLLSSLLLLSGALHAFGHTERGDRPTVPLGTVSIPAHISSIADSLLPLSAIIRMEEEEPDLQVIENEYSRTRNDRRTLQHLYRALKLRKFLRDKKIRYQALYDLAGVSARLRLYPLAMTCYYKTLQLQDSAAADLTDPTGLDNPTNLNNHTYPVNLTNPTDLTDPAFPGFPPTDSALASAAYSLKKSPPVSNDSITASFGDGRPASVYALLIEVKQPAPGRRKAFTGINNVGHMFITLIKYNNDHTCVTRSFGFYPEKDGLFSATPLHPSSSSFFRDDAHHDWDELVGKFISAKRFEKILRLLQRYDKRSYHLSQNNCTDFGLSVATIGGISIGHTKGSWPLGKGNNPANAGQSILEGQVTNMDTDGKDGLFICTTH